MLLRLILVFLFFILNNVSLSAFYNQKFRYDFDESHQYYGVFSEDDFSFNLTNARDDFRSASLGFAYIAPKTIPISLEFGFHIITYRGLENTPQYERRRTGNLDLTILYHFFLPIEAGLWRFRVGGRLSSYGNFGESYVQEAAHLIFGFRRNTTLRSDPYAVLPYLALGYEYSWRDIFFWNGDVQFSIFGDVFVRTALGIDLKNNFMNLDLHIYAQQQYFHEKSHTMLENLARAESGIGLSFRTESDYAFSFLDLMLYNWNPVQTAGEKYGQWIGVSGFGLRFTSAENAGPSQKSKRSYHWLADSLGFRFGVEAPSRYVHTLVWIVNPQIPLSLVTGFSFENPDLGNRLVTSVSWDIWKWDFFSFYLEGGISFTHGQLNTFSPYVYNTPIEGSYLAFSLEIQGGFWFRVWRTPFSEYRLLFNTGFTYTPIRSEYDLQGQGVNKTNLFKYYYTGLSLEIRPYTDPI